ncbi:MAG: hypothetical protein HY908_02545, partial [Myxococcales bacterium]|nr:hypothetical protein [Myxococcales bacterium]
MQSPGRARRGARQAAVALTLGLAALLVAARGTARADECVAAAQKARAHACPA